MRYVNLRDLTTGVQFFDKAVEAWKHAIERANSWSVTGQNIKWTATEGGYALDIGTHPAGVLDAVATSEISLAPDADTLGTGTAVLRIADGVDLTDGDEVQVTSNFTRAVPSGTRLSIGLAADGKTYKLIGADCPPPV